MRKIIALILTVMLCLSFSSCGKNKDVIPAEDALPAVPEVVGEWGSIFFAEESLMTIREDGTCTVLRQPGSWGVHKDFSLWPTILIVAQLDNGKEEQIEFYMYQGEDLGYHEGTLTIKDSELPPAGVVNRTQVDHPTEVASFVLGTWVDGDSTESFATFNEDGTCEILGAKGLWGLNYAPYYNEDFGYGWDYYLFAQIDEQTWKVHVKEGEAGRSTFSVSNGPMKIVDTSEAKNLSRNTIEETQPQYETVEITLDNWQKYFEVIDEPRWKKNAFGEIESFDGVFVSFALKEEYHQKIQSMEGLAIEVQSNYSVVGCEFNIETETYTLTDTHAIDENIVAETYSVNGYSRSIGGGYYVESIQGYVSPGISGSFTNCVCAYPSNIEITRIQGRLTFSVL